MPAGTYNATITFPGDNHFNANATNITFKVGPTDDFTINVKVDNITYGENATVRVLVATDAIGNVTIYVDRVNRGTVNLTNGVATLVVSGLVGGQHVVNVTYNGGPRYAPKDNNTIFAVNPNPYWKVDVTHVEYKPYGEYSTINVTGIPKDILGDNITIRIDNVDYIKASLITKEEALKKIGNNKDLNGLFGIDDIRKDKFPWYVWLMATIIAVSAL